MRDFTLACILAMLTGPVDAQSITQISYDFPAESGLVYCSTAAQLIDGGAFMGLIFNDDPFEFGAMRVDVDGNPVWARKWTGGPWLFPWGHDLGEWGPDHLFIFGGLATQVGDKLLLARVTSGGDLLWANRYDLG